MIGISIWQRIYRWQQFLRFFCWSLQFGSHFLSTKVQHWAAVHTVRKTKCFQQTFLWFLIEEFGYSVLLGTACTRYRNMLIEHVEADFIEKIHMCPITSHIRLDNLVANGQIYRLTEVSTPNTWQFANDKTHTTISLTGHWRGNFLCSPYTHQ